ncbi:hypothetical protein HSBAA_48830 [Vreelandella sulfidaeris]|uniref:Uncharacterized protein n=1 Tax=Vreelandella sulfidaeris TaxID=115553 RepID=A0A455UD82_9GAMM|nr:hypothetical protein HSBAA_48830 [Halomonas sulfidaeris]
MASLCQAEPVDQSDLPWRRESAQHWPLAKCDSSPSYTFVDSGIGYQLNESTKLNAGIYNLFDEEIDYDEYGYVEDGRRVWLGLNIAF